MNIGLTGGIGCGKSTAGSMFEQLGWQLVDADKLVRALLETDPAIHAALLSHFGPEALLPAEAIEAQGAEAAAPAVVSAHRANRAWLAQRIFADPQEREWLEQLLHPLVREQWESRLEAAGESPIVIEIPLLFEKNLEKHFDLTVCVEAGSHVQLARLQARGMSPADAQARIASQMPLAEKVARADKVLSNDGSTDFLHAQVRHLSDKLLADRAGAR